MKTQTHQRVHLILGLIVLGGSAALMHAAQSAGWLQVIKKALPIRVSLDDFDRSRIAPFTLLSIEKFPPETEEGLGTTEYIHWILKEPESPPYRGRPVNLAVTYYTGVVDQVPHVAEECMVQGAFSLATDDTLDMELPSVNRVVPVRRQSYFPPRDVSKKVYVYYTICVNGDFYARRLPARTRMADWSDSHLYYSKVEISFQAPANANHAELDQRASELMDRVVQALIETHWPLPGWEKGGPPPEDKTPIAAAPNPDAQAAAGESGIIRLAISQSVAPAPSARRVESPCATRGSISFR